MALNNGSSEKMAKISLCCGAENVIFMRYEHVNTRLKPSRERQNRLIVIERVHRDSIQIKA